MTGEPSLPGIHTPCRVAVIGVGLIGGSCAAALRDVRPAWTVIGYDRDPNATRWAHHQRILHETTATIADAVKHADVILLATPVGTILDTIGELHTLTERHALVFDVGSTKQAIVQAMAQLPSRFQAVGGHPMTGAVTAGTSQASKRLFEGRAFVVCPTPSTQPATMQWVRALLTDFKANVVDMTAEEHDAAVALVSHLPRLLALPLLQAVEEAGAPTASLVAGGFRAKVQDAGDNIAMWCDILRTNRPAIAAALRAYGEQLQQLQHIVLEGSDDQLREALEGAARAAQRL